MRTLYVLALIVLWLSRPIAFGNPTTLPDESQSVRLGATADILEDSSGSLSIRQAASPEMAARFRPSSEVHPNIGFTASAIWVRLKVKNLTFSEAWVLEAAHSDMDNVELYQGEGEDWELQELGEDLPFDSRKIINPDLLFPLTLPFGKEKTFYLRYQNTSGIALPLVLYSFEQYQGHALTGQLVFGIFFGFMLVLSLYNVILYFKVRDVGYLHYFLYVVSYGLFTFSLYGLAYQYFWPHWVAWAKHSAVFFLAGALGCRLFFVKSVLNSRTHAPRWHRALQALLALLVAWAVYHVLVVTQQLPKPWVLAPQHALNLGALYLLLTTFVVLGINVRCIRAQVPAARIFLYAWLFLIGELAVFILKSVGALPSNRLTESSLLLGSIGEMCLLFISLGENIQAIKTEALERQKHQQAAIQAFQEEQIRSMRLELELLKANIHPHFMLNSINAATMWIREDPAAAEKLLHALSAELRQLLHIVGAKLIPIDEEIRICQKHLEVMSLRHDKSFTLKLEGIVPQETIPPMVFHTLIENGLTHGFANRDTGLFVLSRREDAQGVRFTLFNDGATESKPGESGGLGLQYVRARLTEAYGKGWRLDSHPVALGWEVTLVIQHS